MKVKKIAAKFYIGYWRNDHLEGGEGGRVTMSKKVVSFLTKK